MIDLTAYFSGHPELRSNWEAHADGLLQRTNLLMAEALLDGVRFELNPATGTYVAGNGNGGIRLIDSGVGAVFSNHKRARALDTYDRYRDYASWCMAKLDRLQAHGLFMEDPRYTFSVNGNHWVHHQDIPPKSGKIVFIPNDSPPLGPHAPVWQPKPTGVHP